MKKNRKRLVLPLFIAIFSSLTAFSQTCFYLSPSGSDRADGSARRPLRSLEKAFEKAAACRENVDILLQGGTYRLSKPLVIDTKTAVSSRKISVRALGEQRPVLSGAERLNLKWTPWQRGIWKAEVKDSSSMDLLLVDGKIRPMARFPNYDSTAVRFWGTSAEATSPARIASWKHPETGYLHAMHRSDWGDFHYRILGVRQGALQLEGGWQNNRPAPLHPQNRMVENIFEELDAPGEWFFDVRSRVLYYYPLKGEDIHLLSFETARLLSLVELRGTESRPVENVTFEGVVFTGTRRSFMEKYEPLLRSDWMVHRGGAVFLEGTRGCALRNCDFKNLGGNAVFYSYYNEHDELCGSHFSQIGASAVLFVGDPKAVRSPSFRYGESVKWDEMDTLPGPKGGNYPRRCRVEDNLIHDIGLYEKQTTGVELSMCANIEVVHNTIYNVPRAGINVSEGTWGGHFIAHNDVFNTVRETGDHGAFNSWGRDRFWRAEYGNMQRLLSEHPEAPSLDMTASNVLFHNRFRCDRGWDIDLDDGSSNYIIEDNLCLNGGIKLREGVNRRVENNIMVNNSFHPHVWFRNSGDVFVHNVVTAPYKPIGVSSWGRRVDDNFFTDSLSLRTARKAGTDAHSVVVTPDFVDTDDGDYRFRAGSEVLRMGFHNFPMDNFGVTSPRLRALAACPEMPRLRLLTAEQTAGARLWRRAVVKNLVTLGERSATGMDSERGVYIVSVDGTPESFRQVFRANDVILKINGQTTNDLTQFDAALARLGQEKTVPVTVFREQREQTLSVPCSLLK